jgi:hypothetical protein
MTNCEKPSSYYTFVVIAAVKRFIYSTSVGLVELFCITKIFKISNVNIFQKLENTTIFLEVLCHHRVSFQHTIKECPETNIVKHFFFFFGGGRNLCLDVISYFVLTGSSITNRREPRSCWAEFSTESWAVLLITPNMWHRTNGRF